MNRRLTTTLATLAILAACGHGDPTGTWTGDRDAALTLVPPGPAREQLAQILGQQDAPQWQLELALRTDATFSITADLGSNQHFVRSGTWRRDGDELRLTATRDGDTPLDPAKELLATQTDAGLALRFAADGSPLLLHRSGNAP